VDRLYCIDTHLNAGRRRFLDNRWLKGVPQHEEAQPLQDRILVKRLEEKETKKGGIIIPDSAKEKPQEAEVIAVGPGKVTQMGSCSACR